MPRHRKPYPEEFKRKMIALVREGRTPEELARQFEPSAQAIRNWMAQADHVYTAAGHTANAALNMAVGSTGRVGVGGVAGVPAGALRPTDRFDRELKPRAGWEYDDPIFIFSGQLARDAASAGVAMKLEEVTTVDDAVHLMKRIHDARPRESDARSH